MADDAIPTTPVTKPKDRWKQRDNPDWVSGWKDEEKKDAKEKGWDAATRMAKLKEITKGAKETFVFEEEAAEQPRRRPHRGSRSARSR